MSYASKGKPIIRMQKFRYDISAAPFMGKQAFVLLQETILKIFQECGAD
jgi:hypothetical protein